MEKKREIIFTVGLPGSGKTTHIQKNFLYTITSVECHVDQLIVNLPVLESKNTIKYTYISADDIKPLLNDFNNEHPENVHEESVCIAEKCANTCIDCGQNFIMDGGGINRHYTKRIMEYAKSSLEFNYHIIILFFNVPIEICIDRINKRERKVPIENIYEKSQRLSESLMNLQMIADETIYIDYFTNKYIFLDMDGTICSYTKPQRDYNGNIDFVNCHLFENLKPVQHIIDIIKDKYQPSNIFILTAVPNSIAWKEKQEWLHKFTPFIPNENYLFVGNKDYKHIFLKHFILGKRIDKKDVCVIDDNYSIINNMINIGVNCLHPSDIEKLNK